MTWFKVDDGLHSHPKAIRAIRLSPSSMSLWAMAGSWSAYHLTDGWVSAYAAESLLPRTWRKDAAALVQVGLWRVEERDGEPGWVFHEWADRQPTREEVLRERAATAERQRQWREKWKARRNADPNALRNAEPNAVRNAGTNSVSNGRPDPTRPDPPLKGGGEGERPPASLGGAAAPKPRQPRQQPPAPPPDLTDVRRQLSAASRAARARENRRPDAIAELRAITEDPPGDQPT